MSSQAHPTELTPGQRMRVTALGLLRALATMVVLIALYYLLPLDHDRNVPVTLIAGLLILLAVTAWQLRKVIHHKHPPVRAVEALASVPLFLLLFAWAHFTMAANHPANLAAADSNSSSQRLAAAIGGGAQHSHDWRQLGVRHS